MNPPSALHGAMSRERKPFTYTPGGIDLSQIKSERMAKRLLRNAMDQGVPEHPTTNFQSPPPTLSTTLNVLNYNCLPVQVFPTFPLPTNPKSLLKTRSNSLEQKDRAVSQVEAIKPHTKESTTHKSYGPKQSFANDEKQNMPHLELNTENDNNEYYLPTYEYNVAPIGRPYPNYGSYNNTESILPMDQIDVKNSSYSKNLVQPFNSKYETIEDNNDIRDSGPVIRNSLDGSTPLFVSIDSSENYLPQNVDATPETDYKQKEVKVVKKEVKTENVTEASNEDTDVQAAVTVKLPGKKSAAKTETKVEVVKKVLPDGSIEEVKTTTTKTTLDGKTEITTKTETTIIPKEDDYEEEEVVEEEEEEDEEVQEDSIVENKDNSIEVIEVKEQQENVEKDEYVEENEEEGKSDKNVQKQEESSESSVVKKVTIIQSTNQESSEDELEQEEQEEIQEDEQNEDERDVISESKKEDDELKELLTNGEVEQQNEDEEVHGETNEIEIETKEENDIHKENERDTDVESEKENEDENTGTANEEGGSVPIEDKNEEKLEQSEINNGTDDKSQDVTENQEEISKKEKTNNEQEKYEEKVQEKPLECTQDNKEEIIIEVQVLKPDLATKEEETNVSNEPKIPSHTECNIPLREPSVPLEKVEDVEIKPIGQIISKSHTENTEIITTSLDKPTTGLSTQTAYNRIENIVTVNRTTKTLDHAYEQISQHNVPIVKTSFVPNLENLPSLPLLSRPYQPVYPPEPLPERRHSLLLDRLSVDRQVLPTESYQSNYQFTNQNYEQNQWSQEPQSEVLTVSNVKPSTITKNQQWYQQTKKDDTSCSTPAPTLNVPSQQWNPQQAQPQPQQYLQPQPQVNYQPQQQYQPTYVETQDSYKTTSNTSNIYQQNSFPTYTPKPTATSWLNNNAVIRNTATPTINKSLNQFSSIEKNNTEFYSKPTPQFSSSYVPPPWEQDSRSIVSDDIKLSYTPPSTTDKFSNNAPAKWTPTPTTKFSKPKPTSYIPPAPNQSFVKPVSVIDPPKLPGRKTYYSEYERRYISVPESTYIPTENKFQPQPDPSPQYYYDNNEPSETVEPEWRKELREFSEKTQTVNQGQSEQYLVKPPWEEDAKYYVPKVTTEYNPTPTWSQTLRPNTWRERSFESEFVRSKELPRTNTLGRGRPQSSYLNSNVSAPIPERPRGVSVDRYNSNTYKSPVPSEYPPVVSHTLDPTIGSKTYHNPNVPAYHSRASAEPREQSAAIPQARPRGESRAPPVQSRSFKYLQWITGTED